MAASKNNSLARVCSALETLAPLAYAAPWDNVGLIIAPTSSRAIKRILLTIDVTDAVIEEAKAKRTQLIVAYHPPVFAPLKRIRHGQHGGSSVEQRMLALIRSNIAVYSPHTALDAAEAGVNDWLCQGLGVGKTEAIQAYADHLSAQEQCKLVVFVPLSHADRLRRALSQAGAGVIGDYTQCSFNVEGTGTFLGGDATNPVVGEKGRLEKVAEVRMEMVCSRRALAEIARTLEDVHPYEEPAWEVYPLAPKPASHIGQGRVWRPQAPLSLDHVVKRIKRHVDVDRVRIAVPAGLDVRSKTLTQIGVCAGAGGSVFENTRYDAYITGEMRHHAVLEHLANGAAVILCEHSRSERGYLPTLQHRLAAHLGRQIDVLISETDAEPLHYL